MHLHTYMSMEFHCTKCGGCCMHIGNVILSLRAGAADPSDLRHQLFMDFPFGFTATGACEKYDPATGCTVYNERPDVCRVDKMFELYYGPVQGLTWQQYLYAQAGSCNMLIDFLGLDPEKKVWIS